MSGYNHIPYVSSISEFFELMRFGEYSGDDISVTRIQDQPQNKKIEVPLFRNNIFRIIFLDKADVEWNLVDSMFKASEKCVYFAHPGKLESWKANPDNKGYVVCFTTEFVSDFDSNDIGQTLPFFNPEGRSMLSLSEEEASALIALVEKMRVEAQSYASDRKKMMKYQLYQLLITLHRMYEARYKEEPQHVKNGVRVYNQFKKALDDHFVLLADGKTDLQASVSIIADQLSLTAGYLGALVKEVTGKSAVHHINEKTILEAKSYLLHTDLQMTEIAHRLGFNNVSYFTRYFKKNANVTPKAYQKAVREEL